MKKRGLFRMINTIVERSQKKARRTVDWYKSKHRVSEYFGSPISKNGKVVRRWDLEANNE